MCTEGYFIQNAGSFFQNYQDVPGQAALGRPARASVPSLAAMGPRLLLPFSRFVNFLK